VNFVWYFVKFHGSLLMTANDSYSTTNVLIYFRKSTSNICNIHTAFACSNWQDYRSRSNRVRKSNVCSGHWSSGEVATKNKPWRTMWAYKIPLLTYTNQFTDKNSSI